MDLVIVKKIEDMIGYGYIVLRQFPKSEKFVLGADIRQSMIELLSLAIRCAKRYHKKTSLQDMDIELQKLKPIPMEFYPKSWQNHLQGETHEDYF